MFSNISVLSPEFDIPLDAYVVDRQEELNLLVKTVLVKGKFIWISGRAGTGKTLLLRQLFKLYNNYFKEHRTDIVYVYARNFEEVKRKISDAIKKPEHENTLFLIDESEQLSGHELEQIIRTKQEHDNLKFIFSSRQRPRIKEQELKQNCIVLDLKSPDLFAVLKKRLDLLTDKETRNRASEIINEYLQNFKHTEKTPREVFSEINRLFHDYPDAEQYLRKDSVEIEEDASGKVIEIKVDYVGIIFALVLFLISHFTANQSEENISNKINDVQKTIESVVSSYASENENLYFVNRSVNFRKKPNAKSEILRTLSPNTIVSVIKRKDRWMYVKYLDFVNSSEQYGWVYEKYLSEELSRKK